MKFFHLHVYELYPLRLVMCIARVKLKPSKLKILHLRQWVPCAYPILNLKILSKFLR